ncbi:hypothetical protein BO71DRAFT_23397 [Aspergillus ellipticus CBS 707.79]|uniref:Uncharacterized protein n=1 Tax=Aspergillus ellipticus CBS 707.79 TaxID=1448320 RepID=A0A319DX80_9EURO|nr:hypothetical protein BO71DRAFT_23397 [Aspergillus ellipticus CBS 707.79]
MPALKLGRVGLARLPLVRVASCWIAGVNLESNTTMYSLAALLQLFHQSSRLSAVLPGHVAVFECMEDQEAQVGSSVASRSGVRCFSSSSSSSSNRRNSNRSSSSSR